MTGDMMRIVLKWNALPAELSYKVETSGCLESVQYGY